MFDEVYNSFHFNIILTRYFKFSLLHRVLWYNYATETDDIHTFQIKFSDFFKILTSLHVSNIVGSSSGWQSVNALLNVMLPCIGVSGIAGGTACSVLQQLRHIEARFLINSRRGKKKIRMNYSQCACRLSHSAYTAHAPQYNVICGLAGSTIF